LCGNEVAVATLGTITARKSFGSSAIRHPLADAAPELIRQIEVDQAVLLRRGGTDALVAHAIRDFTSRGDIVFDPFAGVGTTIFAADQWSRLLYRI
jgi:DNA methylase